MISVSLSDWIEPDDGSFTRLGIPKVLYNFSLSTLDVDEYVLLVEYLPWLVKDVYSPWDSPQLI